jgi:hydrogenase maturation protease
MASVEVARRLGGEVSSPGVEVADFGIRGVHLAYELLGGYDTLVLVDAARRGEPPGTLFVLEPDFARAQEPDENGLTLDAHSLDPEMVLAILKDLGGKVGRVLIVGCEPADLSERMDLSPAVLAAVDEATRIVRRLVAEECADTSTVATDATTTTEASE